MLFDLSLDELRKFKPERKEPVGFDAFWAGTIADAEKNDLNAVFTKKRFWLDVV